MAIKFHDSVTRLLDVEGTGFVEGWLLKKVGKKELERSESE